MRILLFLFVSLLLLGEASAQCSMCRAVLESGDAQETAKGINNGIIYLMEQDNKDHYFYDNNDSHFLCVNISLKNICDYQS